MAGWAREGGETGGVRGLGNEVGVGEAGDSVGLITIGLRTAVFSTVGTSTVGSAMDGGSQEDEKRRVSIRSISSAT